MNIEKEIATLAKQVEAKDVSFPDITVKNGALKLVPSYLNSKKIKKAILVVDDNTNEVAGKQLDTMLSETNIETKLIKLKPNKHGQVIADEQILVQLLVATPEDADILIAVGSGTIHDVVRFVGHKMGKPFVSVPTAASVDGFTSKGAPLILGGMKQTIQTASPIAVFADIDILKAAPREMTAAGFGDILGKYTSLLDWNISNLVGNEPYNRLAEAMTRECLEECVKNVDSISNGDDEGIKILIRALIDSGLIMLVLDFSRPASGAEHHLSHFWEMDLLKSDSKQLLHGAKVGVTTAIIVELYKKLQQQLDINTLDDDSLHKEQLIKHWDKITGFIEELPSPDEIKALLKKVGGPQTHDDLGIPISLVEESLNEAFKLRDRCTGLLLINELKKNLLTYPLETLAINGK
ncbi:sn-glycerol-1-phosphate dehydrogenase [Aquibacillus saliphilus]|uniref:sn-glycerol-1-phosphate dehydrogenase n=1 Tax=Aquibacillus saliphilus TaxID=1909422 RepID=UPI001CF0B42F|nr:sn-glycerol-1-phosphate dehydrogenase [Aquibacillus saliphilus]